MSRTICFLMALVLSISLCVPAMAQETGSPVIALTACPAYGEIAPIEGVVYTESGEGIDVSQYRISLYLQITAGGSYWVKPTYDHPYADINPDGTFSIQYVTGGVDETATILHLFLIPASYTPDSSYSATKEKALDSVVIRRTSKGSTVVTPNREAPALEVANQPSGLKVSPESVCLDVGFYLQGSPNGPISVELMEQQLNAIRPYSDTIRLYSASGEVAKAYPLAKTLGFRVVGSAWLSGDEAADKRELDALIELCNSGLCCAAVAGSETLLRGDLTPAELIQDLNYVREHLTDSSIPVTTADSVDCILQNAGVRNACDFLFVNAYPYWSGVGIEHAAESFIASVETLKAKCPGKEVVISETGWPTEGNATGEAMPGEQEAADYFAAVGQWSLESGTVVFWFDAADEPWKAASEGTVGAHWGILTKDCELKSGYEALSFFQTTNAAASLSNFRKTNSVLGSPFTDVSRNDWFYQNVRAVYEYGLMDGVGSGQFSPAGTLTVAEAITLACRLYTTYHGDQVFFPVEGNWYDGYVAYAKAVNLIGDNQFTDYDKPISRREIAQIFAKALPEQVFESIHTVTAIPDVTETTQEYASIFLLYSAGILTGTDSAGSFSPDKTVTRAEIAAMMTRIVEPGLRK